MSIEAVVPTNSRSFVYEGCYRPRGSLTFAERSAWGLRLTGHRPSAPSTRASGNIERASAFRSKLVTFHQGLAQQGLRHTHAIVKYVKRERRFRVCCLSSVALRSAKRVAHQRALVRPKQLASWLRLEVKIGAGSVTCIVTPRRSFVAGFVGPKVRPR